MKEWLKNNWFILGLLAAVFFAWLFPDPGARGGMLQSENTTRLGVVLIFFFQGLTLSPAAIKSGLMQWRLHVFVQAFIFLIIPLAALAMILASYPVLSQDLRTGFFFLAVLPTTIATSVAYTFMTRGNVAGAVFNSSLANVAGILITPLWVSVWLQAGGVSLPLGQLLLDISMLLLAPLLVGQLLRPLTYRLVDALKKPFSITSSLIILFIVYAAFCNSWKDGIWEQEGAVAALIAGAGSVVFLALVLGLVVLGIRLFHFDHQNAMAALFCAPQKTMAAGVPMANLIFEHHPALGLILLPLMFYHLLQLLVGGVLVSRINAARQ
ncbi:bile acid:sodium symporter family protein [Desulfonatronospira sp.]|uniref:bile acid:sodium symporter family protein n=1 Tax=Desulfonatronospira sp. TaxID=1962951 RepID=UPI0025C5DA6F|nr:bile acid:sodium symporter family protein [Desulfonatronospira sp.]